MANIPVTCDNFYNVEKYPTICICQHSTSSFNETFETLTEKFSCVAKQRPLV